MEDFISIVFAIALIALYVGFWVLVTLALIKFVF